MDITVNAAVASLGATYEAVVLQPNDRVGSFNALVTRQYNKALASLQSDVVSQSHGPTPLFLASIVLAAVEVLLRHLTNALLHLQGAFTILTECIRGSKQFSTPSSLAVRNDESEHHVMNEDGRALYLLGQALDIQTATYVLSRAPDLPILPSTISHRIPEPLLDSFSLDQAHSELLALLHACYHHSSLASAYKYLRPGDIPSDIALNQGRIIAHLSQWLSKLDYHTASPTRQDTTHHHLSALPTQQVPWLILRIQCISAIIYLSTRLSPEERAYDSFATFFLQIVDNATTIVENRSAESNLARLQNRFRLISPLSQPLYLTAMKCRHGGIRRRAISLLSNTGLEGPWHAAVHVRVARRAMEIEEQQIREEISLKWAVENVDNDTIIIPENMRLHGCGIDSDRARQHGSGVIEAQFSRCVDVGHMLMRANVQWDSQDNWEIWTERLQL